MQKLHCQQLYQKLLVDITPYNNIDLAKFRRDLVLKNLNQNGFLNFEKYNEYKNQNIKLKKKKKIYLEDAQYYIEDVRKNIIDKLTYEKVYKQGYNINTPINLNLQKIATESLRNGLIAYDKRKGWRGPITNIKYDNNWHQNIDKKYKLENSINWEVAIVKKIIEEHGGVLKLEDSESFDSEDIIGALISIELPKSKTT